MNRAAVEADLVLRRLRTAPDELRVAVLVAHPDDETIGLGGLLGHFRDVTLVHLTDGVPRDQGFAHRAGFGSRRRYALVRRKELRRATALAGIDVCRLHRMGRVDQEVICDLAGTAHALMHLLGGLEVDALFTHPYEGGHPDHDAAALVGRAVTELASASGRAAPPIIEMAFYHRHGGALRTGRFLRPEGSLVESEISVRLDRAQQERKRRMLSCYGSQSEVLAPFGVAEERFRAAPRYDFTRPPHEGPLHYETLGWDLSGARWRALAIRALRGLGVHETGSSSR